ncbi:two-component system response regulator [Laceyella sacchari]|jgi:two-component system CitB family response regulator|uniref:Transcriptional regulatory protein n=1 Tax=Laceyella tengchongensis TaxID=574699 RepID=A0AA45WK89_9BACL|nr:response regulator [Laceyella tengchongensis]AUS08344.1 two-component system response regulator [Laceyella sacchari]SMP05913.1 two-component system, CitB family, response regulator [Laceyella tengchongensis]
MSKLKPIEVLIVEDDARVAKVNRRFMEKIEGFQVVGIAANGQEAKVWLEEMRPQLVLLDVYLPDMKGIELVWYIRQHCKDIDIIMITAAEEIEVIQDALRGGVFDYLVKPVLFDRFKQSMEKYRLHLQTLSSHQRLDQKQVDQLLGHVQEPIPEKHLSKALPKGIDPVTLEKVVQVVQAHSEQGLTAEQVGKHLGASRTTARRYLEYLVSIKRIRADHTYGTIGRPERKYYAEQI